MLYACFATGDCAAHVTAHKMITGLQAANVYLSGGRDWVWDQSQMN